MPVENDHIYSFDFRGHSYNVRSDDKQEEVEAVFARMTEEAEKTVIRVRRFPIRIVCWCWHST